MRLLRFLTRRDHALHLVGGRKAEDTTVRMIDLIMIHAVMSRGDSYAIITHFRFTLRNAD